MFTVFEEVSQGIYQKTLVDKKDCVNESFILEYNNGQPIAKGESFLRLNCNIKSIKIINFKLHADNGKTITSQRGKYNFRWIFCTCY